MKIKPILLISIIIYIYAINIEAKNNKNNGNSNKNNGNSNKNKGSSNENKSNNNNLCCEEAGKQNGLFCRCYQACAGNPCNAGQGIGFGGGRYCATGHCCCGDGCKKSVIPDTTCTTPTTTTTSDPTTSQPTTADPTTADPTTADPTTSDPTTADPTTADLTTADPTTAHPTTADPTTADPTTADPTTADPTTAEPTTAEPTTAQPTPSRVPTCNTDIDLTVTPNSPWTPASSIPHYFTNCVIVALDGTVDWDNTANLMGTNGNRQISQLNDSNDGPYFDEIFSVTNDFGSDNVIRITAFNSDWPPPSAIILESWSLPIIAVYNTVTNKNYYIEQTRTDEIPNDGSIIIINNTYSQTIEWDKLSSVTFDGIAWLSEKSGLADVEVVTTVTATQTLNNDNGISLLNDKPTNDNAFMHQTDQSAYSNDDDFITSPVGILVLVIVGILIIVIFGFIGMKCIQKILKKRNATVHFEN